MAAPGCWAGALPMRSFPPGFPRIGLKARAGTVAWPEARVCVCDHADVSHLRALTRIATGTRIGTCVIAGAPVIWCAHVCHTRLRPRVPASMRSAPGSARTSIWEAVHRWPGAGWGHVDTTSVEWPIQSKMQVNLAGGKKKTRQSDEESESGGCLSGWTDCLGPRGGTGSPGPSWRNWRRGPDYGRGEAGTKQPGRTQKRGGRAPEAVQ